MTNIAEPTPEMSAHWIAVCEQTGDDIVTLPKNDLLILLRLSAPQEPDDATGWLIEEDAGGFIHWIALAESAWPRTEVKDRRLGARTSTSFERYLSPVQRVKDANEALRFARKQDAEAVIKLFDRFLLNPIATEHCWPKVAQEPVADDDAELIELVAKAIWHAQWEEPWPSAGGIEHAHALEVARAALEASATKTREALAALVALIDRLAEGQCGPFAIRNSIANSPEMDEARAILARLQAKAPETGEE